MSPSKIPTHPGCVSHMIKNVSFFLWWSAETGMRKDEALQVLWFAIIVLQLLTLPHASHCQNDMTLTAYQILQYLLSSYYMRCTIWPFQRSSASYLPAGWSFVYDAHKLTPSSKSEKSGPCVDTNPLQKCHQVEFRVPSVQPVTNLFNRSLLNIGSWTGH